MSTVIYTSGLWPGQLSANSFTEGIRVQHLIAPEPKINVTEQTGCVEKPSYEYLNHLSIIQKAALNLFVLDRYFVTRHQTLTNQNKELVNLGLGWPGS